MPRKNVREMTRFELARHSLGSKMFRMVLLFAIIIAIASLVMSFVLYTASVRRDHKKIAYNLANSVTAVTDKDQAWNYSFEILKIYDEMPEEIKADPTSEEYHAYFSGVIDAGFLKLRAAMHSLQVSNDADAIVLAAIDEKNQRLIYLVDSDYSDTFCLPGTYETVSQKELDAYAGHGVRSGWSFFGDAEPDVPAYISNTKEFGYLCTGADEIIAGVRGYRIMSMADINMGSARGMAMEFLWRYAIILLVIAVLICFAMTFYVRRKVVEPIKKLTAAAEQYSIDKRNHVETGEHFEGLQIETGDELENLGLIMKDMEKDISSYEENLTRVTSEKERIGAELDVAKKLQESMVPHTYPAFPDREEFMIYATMETAKEIGGDFYDFFLVDQDHLAVVMADVSGKGIPAALFMMASQILIRNTTMIEKHSPARILESVNEQVCQNNEADMFVTVWLGILELSTGILRCANAGHEYPVIKHAGENYELFKDPHGFVIGGMEGMKYKEYEVQLEPGSGIFVYTDGVPEAVNAENQMFGTARMVEALNADPEADAMVLLGTVKQRINDFVGNIPQFDDITMSGLVYYGPKDKMLQEITIDAKKEFLPIVQGYVDEQLELHACGTKAQMQIGIAVEELFVNVASYAYAPETGSITIGVEFENDMAAIRFTDSGRPFDPFSKAQPDLSLPAEEREIGGLGIHMVKQSMDEVSYEYKDGKNIVTIRKRMN